MCRASHDGRAHCRRPTTNDNLERIFVWPLIPFRRFQVGRVPPSLKYLSGLDNDRLSLLLSGANRCNSKKSCSTSRFSIDSLAGPLLFFNNLSSSVSLVMADAFIFTAVFHSASPSSASAFRSIAQRCTDAHRLLVG